MSSSLLEILALMEQVIKEQENSLQIPSFGVTKQDLDKNNFQIVRGHVYPSNHASNKEIFDQEDLKEFYNKIVKTKINQYSTDATISNLLRNNLSPLIQVVPFIPQEQQEAYREALKSTLTSIFQYWLRPEDRLKTGRMDKERLKRIATLVIVSMAQQLAASEIPELKELGNNFRQDYLNFQAAAEKEMQAGAASVTGPAIRTTRLPKNLQDYNALMGTFFEAKNDLRSRVNQLKKLADFFGKPIEDFKNEAEKMSATEFMSYVVMMDYLVEIAKGFDAQSGRYLLEYLLAVVSMGEVKGATLGAAGQQDAVDFVDEENNLGSSKFISSYDKVGQAPAGFEGYEGKKITYVVALKEGSPFRLDTNAPEPLDVQQIKVHIFDVMLREIGGKRIKTYRFDVFHPEQNEKNDSYAVKEGARLNIGDIAQKAPSFTIPLVFTTEKGTKTYRQMLSTSLGETKQDLLKIVKTLFDELKKADEMSRKYTVTGKPEDGGAALTSLEKSQVSLSSLSGFAGEESKFVSALQPSRFQKPNNQ
jgi:hypothetical protein